MAYVLTHTEMSFAHSERDFAGFERNHQKRVERVVDAMTAPTRTERHLDDYGRPFTVHLHVETGLVVNVTA